MLVFKIVRNVLFVTSSLKEWFFLTSAHLTRTEGQELHTHRSLDSTTRICAIQKGPGDGCLSGRRLHAWGCEVV